MASPATQPPSYHFKSCASSTLPQISEQIKQWEEGIINAQAKLHVAAEISRDLQVRSPGFSINKLTEELMNRKLDYGTRSLQLFEENRNKNKGKKQETGRYDLNAQGYEDRTSGPGK